MTRFEKGRRIVVIHPISERESLRGKCGTVERLLMRSAEAWVTMDEDVGPLASFPNGDDRHNNVCLWPEECEPTARTAPEATAQ